MLARWLTLLIVVASPVALSDESHAEQCVSINGTTSIPELARRVLQSLAGAGQAPLAQLPVDECAWKRAQWLLGQDRAERLAWAGREGLLEEAREDLRKLLENEGITLDGKIDAIEGPRDDGKVKALVSAKPRWVELEFYAVEIDGRWYLAKHSLDFNLSRSLAFRRFSEGMTDLSSSLIARGALEGTAANVPLALDVFKKWQAERGTAAVSAAQNIFASGTGEINAAKAEVFEAFVQLSEPDRANALVSKTLQDIGAALGVPAWDFERPTGNHECDALFRHSAKCAKGGLQRSLAIREAFMWLDKPMGVTCSKVLSDYKGRCRN